MIARTATQVADRARLHGLQVELLRNGLYGARVALGCPVCMNGVEVILEEDGGALTGSCNFCRAQSYEIALALAEEPPRRRAAAAGEPAPSIATTLDRVHAFLTRYVVFPNPAQPVACALWAAHTHAIGAADVSPPLHVSSPEKRSGKTRTLDVLELLVPRPWRVVTPSEAVTFRKINRDHPTLLLDEVDAIFKGKQAAEHEGLRAILNSGYQRGTTVPRCVGPKMELTDFEVFGAKALAGIGRVPDTIADRSIPIRLKRRRRDELVERFRKREVLDEANAIRDDLAVWAAEHEDALRAARPEMPTTIIDRAEEAWEVLVAIADLAGGEWPARARAAAVALATGGDDDDEQGQGIQLLSDVQAVLDAGGNPDRIFTSDLLEGLYALEESPWADWYGHPLSAEKLGRFLRPYGVKSKLLRVGEKVGRGYTAETLEDAFSRYLATSTRYTRYNPHGWAENEGSATRYKEADVTGSESAANPHGCTDVTGVTGTNAENGVGAPWVDVRNPE